MSFHRNIAAILATAALSTLSLTVAAQSLDVKCEVRSNRSKASVDGKNLASGQYSAVLTSGGNTAQSPLESTRGDEVEFDFDSNRRDIRQGATAIPSNFIVDRTVTGQLLDAAGNVVATDTANCRRK
jgi:hypothetical protein